VTIPDGTVKETRAELHHRNRDESFRNLLLEFVALYKSVVDTLVRKKTQDVTARAKVYHTYLELTPEAARGATFTFNVRGKATPFVSPAFKKSSIMLNDEYLAVILLMSFQRNPFFLWLLGLFAGGAMAPKIPVDANAAGTTPASNNKIGKKRARGSPALACGGVGGGSGGGGLRTGGSSSGGLGTGGSGGGGLGTSGLGSGESVGGGLGTGGLEGVASAGVASAGVASASVASAGVTTAGGGSACSRSGGGGSAGSRSGGGGPAATP